MVTDNLSNNRYVNFSAEHVMLSYLQIVFLKIKCLSNLIDPFDYNKCAV